MESESSEPSGSLPEAAEFAEQVEQTGDETPVRTRKPLGRPRKDGLPPGSVVPQDQRIPRAKCRDYKPNVKDESMRTQAGFDYWNNLNAWAKSQIIAYVYRDHPILKLREDDPKREKEPGSNPNIDKIVGEVLGSEDDVLRRYGSGDYHIRLNDPKGTITTLWMKALGGGDYRSNPPNDSRINDIEQIDLDHPSNGSYIAYLRGEGRLPAQQFKRDEDDMATIQIAEKAIEANERLTNRLLNDKGKEPSGASTIEVLEMADKLAEKYVNRGTPEWKDAVEAIRGEISQLRQGAGTNVTDVLQIALQMFEKFGGGQRPGVDPEVQALRSQIQHLSEQRIQSLERQLELARAPIASPATHTLKDQLEALREARSFMDEIGASKAAEGNPVEEAAKDFIPKWMRPVAPFLPMLAQGVTAWLMSKSTPQGPQGTVPAGFPVPQQSQPQTQPALPAPAPNGLSPEIVSLLTAIQYPLVSRLNDAQSNGEDFAEFFAEGWGLPSYQWLKEQGEEQIRSVLYAFPPIATSISTVPQAKVQSFIREFVGAKFEDLSATAPVAS